MVPNSTEPRQDIIQAVTLKKSGASDPAFCKEIQAAAPLLTVMLIGAIGYARCKQVRSLWRPGAFVQGSSVELSADGPVKRAICRIFPGGLTWEHAKLGVMMSLQKLVEGGIW